MPVPAVISQNSKLEGHFNSWPHHRTTCRFFREAKSSDPAKKRQAKARKLVGREISREKANVKTETKGSQKAKEAKTVTKPARQRVTKADKQKQSKRECSHAGRQIRREKRQRPKEMDKPAKIYERSDTKETKVQERTHPPMLREKRTKTT